MASKPVGTKRLEQLSVYMGTAGGGLNFLVLFKFPLFRNKTEDNELLLVKNASAEAVPEPKNSVCFQVFSILEKF